MNQPDWWKAADSEIAQETDEDLAREGFVRSPQGNSGCNCGCCMLADAWYRLCMISSIVLGLTLLFIQKSHRPVRLYATRAQRARVAGYYKRLKAL